MDFSFATIVACLGIGAVPSAGAAVAVDFDDRPLPTASTRVELRPGVVHRYRVPALPGGTHVRIDQFGIDVVVALQDSSGAGVRVNAPGGPQDREDAVIDARAGDVTITVQAKLTLIPAGHYSIAVAPVDASDAPAGALRAMSAAGSAELAESAQGQQAALRHLDSALALVRADPRQRPLVALLTFRTAVMSRRLNDNATAIATYRRALALDMAARDSLSEARTRNGLGLALRAIDRIAEARREFEAALRAAERAGDAYEAASAENNVCVIFLHRGEMLPARNCLERVVARYRRDGLGEHASVALLNLAAAYDFLGLPAQSRAGYREALALRRGGPERLPVAQILLNLAVLERNVGEPTQALAAIDEAIALLREIGDRALLARALRTKGSIFQVAGLPARASIYFREALPIAQSLGDRRGEADLRSALADVADSPAVAAREHRAALALYDAAADASSSARERIAIARLAREAGQPDEARGMLALGCALARRTQVRSVRFDCALETTRLALHVGDDAAVRRGLAATRRYRSRAAAEADRLAVARLEVAAARRDHGAASAQALAEQVLRDPPRLAASVVGPELRERDRAARAALLSDWIDAVVDAGAATPANAAAIVAMLERERLRELDAWIAWGSRALAPDAVAHVQQLRHRRAALEAAERSGEAAPRIAELQRELEASAAALDRDAPRQVIAATPATSLATVVARLRPGTVASIHALGHRHSLAIWLTRDGAHVVTAADATTVRDQAASLLSDIATFGARAGQDDVAAALSAALLRGAPLDGETRWHAVLDGALQAVPLAVLVDDDGARLIDRVSSIVTPSLAWLDDESSTLLDTRARIAVFADPAFGEPGDAIASASVKRGDPGLPRLPATSREADMIASLAGADRATIWRREQATGAALIASLPAGYDIVHVAAHASIDTRRFDASAILLAAAHGESGAPSTLAIADVLSTSVRAGLVVLSGCATSRGRDSAHLGAFGLTEAFLAAGAGEVVGALWPVDDDATAALMVAFYRHRFQGADTPTALRLAQRERAAAGGSRDWAAFRVTAGARVSAPRRPLTGS